MELFAHERQTLLALSAEGYRPAVVYDIGASNGVWSDVMALAVPDAEFHLFEPLAEAVPFYRNDLAERLARRPQFHLHRIALADRGGDTKMFATHDGFGSSMLDRGNIPEVNNVVTVPVYTLDEFVAENSLPPADVMKLDVQGAERLILTGGCKSMEGADVLFMETWLKRGYGPTTPLLTEMISFLEKAGFSLVKLGEEFRDERHRIYSVDAVFFSESFLSTDCARSTLLR